MKYDVIIIGAGAAGLFCAANCKVNNGLILDKSHKPGLKLLISGAGQCNFTHGGDIKDFLDKYGPNGKKIRTPLYKFNNQGVMDFFTENGVPLIVRDDLKVFPKSLKAADIRDLLLKKAAMNGFSLKNDYQVTTIKPQDGGYLVNGEFLCQKLVIGTGGASFPQTGSDGQISSALVNLGLDMVPQKPALTPISVENYNLTQLSGLSFDSKITLTKQGQKPIVESGDLLLTHRNLSGPAILNLSRYPEPGDKLEIDFAPNRPDKLNCDGISKGIGNYIAEKTGLPKRFIKHILDLVQVDETTKASTINKSTIKNIDEMFHHMRFTISGTGGFKEAMVTAGGVALNQVSMKTMESKKHPGLHLIGEVLDVDGNTGGYNIQFAFSSGYIAAQHISL
ncbi:MAG: NAD(P)/FAD-dependent oxidoreductase [Anaerovoracaceae bacterium]